MRDWKEKSLSQAGKEVLIKTVIQAMPSYAMQCFLLPITTCQEIEKQIARFFWGSSLEERKCHWASWKKMATSKTQGGIGFRDIHLFNLAMLAKQFWGIMQVPTTLSSRILHAKYSPRGHILHAKLGYKPSYLWRSLLASKELVQDGMAWMIGNGKSVDILKDRWVGIDNVKKPNSILSEEWWECKVDKLLIEDTGQWNQEVIENIFEQTEARKILAMPRPLDSVEDQMVWRFTKQGWFSVKSAYDRAVEISSNVIRERASPSTVQKGWKKLWEIQTIPRVRLFLWKACANALPVKVNMARRGCAEETTCELCGEEAETVEHLFLYCTQTMPVWYASSLRINMQSKRFATFRDFLWTSMESFPPDYVSQLAYLTWEIWNRRNAKIFEDKPFKFHEVILKAGDRWSEEFQSRESPAKKKDRLNVVHKWSKPPSDEYKLNTDIAVWPDGRVGFGYVLRDHRGNVTLAGKIESRVNGNSTILEGLLMCQALQEMIKYRRRAHYIECDNQALVEQITGTVSTDLHAKFLVSDIKALMEEVGCTVCKYIPRQANQVAHYIVHGPNFISLDHNPMHVISFIEMDVIAE